MVVLNRIYTRTGDKGETALSNGERVRKDSLRVAAYGTVDELNATLGLARLHGAGELAERIAVIQNDLFDLGADLARPRMHEDAAAPHPVLRIIESQVDRLEREIDAMNAHIAPLRSFILPGGSALAAHLHLARTVARRAERAAVALSGAEDANPAAVKYLNRLSDWLFVAGRVANDQGRQDILWVPGASR
ncbi:cob(I)yrinic acid a,c-diamide adenosyltransferase [Paracoccus sp. (in: a-proteobacteria)]|uniref:cob(I)yrinic acid a,c-diamide adenosyltransferase n=1 Tax=Paracoccus sp. TaxID=267 RepID=UPI0032205B0E